MFMSLFTRIIDFLIKRYARLERWMLLILGAAFLLSLAYLLTRFYRAETILVPTTGGTYIEGSVSDLQPLNPWFTITNDVNRDIVSLVFAGLLKYNPQTKKVEEDLATMRVSSDGMIYTLRLKDDLFWHDSTEESPHPVTAEDVVFTFQTIQDPHFPNQLLRQNFRGVAMAMLNERSVQFRLEEPYSFFPSNLTLGLLPKQSFTNVPVNLLDQALDFGFQPVGAGPYRLKSIVQTDLSVEVTLERFARNLEPVYHLDRIVFRIFSDYATLLSDLRNLDGIRTVPATNRGVPAIPKRFKALTYTLPQYVALFFNLDHPVLADQKLRLGLQLGTDKQEIVNVLGESLIVDTPLLEIDTSDWRYHFDPAAAQGALFTSAWYFPEKVRLQKLLEQREANTIGPLRLDPIILLETGGLLTLTGSFTAGTTIGMQINAVPLGPGSESGTWIVRLPTTGTGAIHLGENLLKLTDGKRIVDSFYIWRAQSPSLFQAASEEQRLLDLFLVSRDTTDLPENARITVKDLVLDHGFLRRRRSDDAIGIRINDLGQPLVLTLLTSPSPEKYREIAQEVKRQWALLGVRVNVVVPETRTAFEEQLLKRSYDVLLFGQSLLDNLDSYPYWHSSGAQSTTGNRSDLRLDAYNLSQYRSFEADTLLESIRRTTDERERDVALGHLREVLKRDVPAVFLYSPVYTLAHREEILGVELGHLSLHSDRFLSFHRWYVEQDRLFAPGKNWMSFFGWLSSSLRSDSSSTDVSTPVGSGAHL